MEKRTRCETDTAGPGFLGQIVAAYRIAAAGHDKGSGKSNRADTGCKPIPAALQIPQSALCGRNPAAGEAAENAETAKLQPQRLER